MKARVHEVYQLDHLAHSGQYTKRDVALHKELPELPAQAFLAVGVKSHAKRHKHREKEEPSLADEKYLKYTTLRIKICCDDNNAHK